MFTVKGPSTQSRQKLRTSQIQQGRVFQEGGLDEAVSISPRLVGETYALQYKFAWNPADEAASNGWLLVACQYRHKPPQATSHASVVTTSGLDTPGSDEAQRNRSPLREPSTSCGFCFNLWVAQKTWLPLTLWNQNKTASGGLYGKPALKSKDQTKKHIKKWTLPQTKIQANWRF